jgi:hypothetical protein
MGNPGKAGQQKTGGFAKTFLSSANQKGRPAVSASAGLFSFAATGHRLMGSYYFS